LLIISPGLTGLQNRPDHRPSARTVFVQTHPFGDGASSLENRGRRRMASGEKADVRAWIAHAGDRIDGQIAGLRAQEVLVEEVSVQQHRPLCSRTEPHGGCSGHTEPGKSSLPSSWIAAGPLLVVGILARSILESRIDPLEGRERERPGRDQMQSHQKVSGYHNGCRVITAGQRYPWSYSLQQQRAVGEVHVDEMYRCSRMHPPSERGRLSSGFFWRDRQLNDDFAAAGRRAREDIRAEPAIEAAASLEVPAALACAQPRPDVHDGIVPSVDPRGT
jgi:hypothetical protein